MKITVTDGNQVANFDVDTDQLVEDVKALVEAEIGVPFERSQLHLDGKLLANNEKLNEVGAKDGALLFLSVSGYQQAPKKSNVAAQSGGAKMSIAEQLKSMKQGGGSVQKPPSKFHFMKKSEAEYKAQAQRIYNELKGDKTKLAEIGKSNPEIAEAILSEDINKLSKVLQNKHEERIHKLEAEENRFVELSKDPMNPEYQRMLEERINQENIDHNLQFANEYIPEVFGSVNMLYINATINKVPIQAFVDSGAQSTIMSQELAQKCGLMRLVDKRSAGTAVGVGSCKILGRIHAAEIEIEKKFITCSFTVIENNSVSFLLGLDMLKRFSCVLDLKKNSLNFQDGMIITHFLGDGEIKKNMHPTKKEDIEPKLKKLIGMGFGKEEALHALQSCNYNEEVAGNMLMQKKYGQ